MNSFINERDKYKLNLFAKAATTTMKLWFLYDMQGRHDEFVSNPPDKPIDRDGTRIKIHRSVNPLAVRDHRVGSDYQIFTVVRNPYRRLASAYSGVIKSENARGRFMEKSGIMVVGESFAEFVDLLYEGKLGENVHWTPQSRLLGPAGNILKVESLGEDFDMKCEKLGKTKGRLPRFNPNRKHEKDPADRYTEEIAAKVLHLYAADFERFGFSTDLPDGI